jgi:Kef-type K+ transport system membrane component KefB
MLPFQQFILAIAIIIAAAKIGGYLSFRLGQPSVAGEVVAGLILGPSVLNMLQWSIFSDQHLGESIIHLAEIGVLSLLFIAGIDIHISDLTKLRKPVLLAGSLGFILTLGMGYILATFFSFDTRQALYIGLLLAPTSVGISAQVLMELGVLRSKAGISLLGAAAVDDILGVLGVSVFQALFLGAAASELTGVLLIMLEMVVFLVAASAIGIWILPKFAKRIERAPMSQGLIAFVFVTVLIYAWSAEALGMAAIIGALFAGLFFSRSSQKEKIKQGFSPIAYGVFVPIFFINVGLSANVRTISSDSLLLLAGMIVVVVLSKLGGAGIAGRLSGMTSRESLQFGFGMIPRGEVVLILATVGIVEALIDSKVFSTVVVLVVLTTLVTPPILRFLFSNNRLSSKERK